MSIADSLFRSFMEIVIAGGVFADSEREFASGQLHETALKDVISGKRLDVRRPWLMTLSGKGGFIDGPDFEKRRRFRNVTLLDHLLSVTRGAATFAEMDLRAAGMPDDMLRVRIARIVATAFLHDADKMLTRGRLDDLTTPDIAGLMQRYRVGDFLSRHVAEIAPDALLSRINHVEISRADMIRPGMKILTPDAAGDCLYVRLADRLDGIFLDMSRPLSDVADEIAKFEGLRSPALKKGWTPFTLKSPHTPFLLDQLQKAFSAAVHDLTGHPPLIEVHHDGELLLACQSAVADDAMRAAIANASSLLRLRTRVDVNARGTRDILDGGAALIDLQEAIDDGIAAKALYLHKDLLSDADWRDRFDMAFQETGLPPVFTSLEKFSGQHFQPWPALRDEDERTRSIRIHAAMLAVSMGCAEPVQKALAERTPGAEMREQELVQLAEELGLEIPEWITAVAHKGSRQSLLAVWFGCQADRDGDVQDRIFGAKGLLETWLLGDGSGRASLFEKIGDPAARFISAATAWLEASLSRHFLSAEEENVFGTCHFTAIPVTKDAVIDGKSGLSGLKVSAFSGREGRPWSHDSSKAQTLVSAFAAAEHRLRSMQGKVAGRASDVPAFASSPTSMGLFATLGLNRSISDEFLDIDHYDLMRLDRKSGKRIYVDLDSHGSRVAFARHVSLPVTTSDTVSFIRMMMKSALRLGRPVHVFQGLPQACGDFVFFDILPPAVRKAFRGNGLRLEQMKDALHLLGIAEQLMAKEMQNVGIEVALRLLDPDTRLGAACEAISTLDRLPEDRSRALGGLRASLMTIARQELQMAESPLIEFARAMTRVQAAPDRSASNSERGLGLRVALEAVENSHRIGETSGEALRAAIAGELEQEFERSGKLKHRGEFRDRDFPMRSAMEAADVFVTKVWPATFRGRAPASKERRIAFAIYQVAFQEESWKKRTAPAATDTDTGAETPAEI